MSSPRAAFDEAHTRPPLEAIGHLARSDQCPRWARGNRVKVASAASVASATLTRLSTPVRSRGGASRPSSIGRTSELVAAARSRALPADPPSIRADDDASITTPEVRPGALDAAV
jgi:hypothetical protein